jgi:hypothetical protein
MTGSLETAPNEFIEAAGTKIRLSTIGAGWRNASNPSTTLHWNDGLMGPVVVNGFGENPPCDRF